MGLYWNRRDHILVCMNLYWNKRYFIGMLENISIYIYFARPFFCLCVCIQYTSKRLNRSGPIFLWNLTTTPKKVYGCSKLQKKLCHKFCDFCKILKMRENITKSANSVVIVLYCTKRRCSQIELQLKN